MAPATRSAYRICWNYDTLLQRDFERIDVKHVAGHFAPRLGVDPAEGVLVDPSKPVYTILSFVGGGIRGLMSATILERLDAVHNGVLNRTQMLAGCSTGAIITSELLAGKSPKDLVDLFTGGELGFYDAMNPDPRTPAYSIDKVLASQEDAYLKLGRKVPTVAELGRDVLLVSFNVGKVTTDIDNKMMPTPWGPMMFTNMLGTERDKLDGLFGNSDTTIAKAATSSGAMPGQLGSMDGNVDGAFFNHDPTVAAICLAVRNGHPLENIVAITIGTGLMPYWLQSDTHDWGAKQWMQGNGNPFDNVTPFLMNQSVSSPVLDLSLNGTSSEVMPNLAKMLLGDRYVNINPRLPCFIPENSTNAQAIALLQRHGKEVNIDDAVALIGTYWNIDSQTPKPVTRSVAGTPAAAAKMPSAPESDVNPKPTPGHGQQFFIQHKGGDNQVLDVDAASSKPGADVILYAKKGLGDPGVHNQLWEFIPSLEDSGWWYLQTTMGSGLVMTIQASDALASDALAEPKITMESAAEAIKDRQLWNLVSTEELGYFFIQSKYFASNTPIANPDSYVPNVMGVHGKTQPPRIVGLSLDYEFDAPMAFSFTPYN
ncbi:patatin-like phospholipase family protein [Variovorax sp. GB4R4]